VCSVVSSEYTAGNLVPSIAVERGERSCSGPDVTMTGCEIPGCEESTGGVNQ